MTTAFENTKHGMATTSRAKMYVHDCVADNSASKRPLKTRRLTADILWSTERFPTSFAECVRSPSRDIFTTQHSMVAEWSYQRRSFT